MTTRNIQCNIADLVGLTMTKVEVKRDVDDIDYNDELVFTSTDGRVFKFYHDRDCCETVYIESIAGDVNDLVGSPIVIASESSNGPFQMILTAPNMNQLRGHSTSLPQSTAMLMFGGWVNLTAITARKLIFVKW